MTAMRRVDLELLVQRVVEGRRAGLPAEDDRVELKRDWPEPTKARQLAGAANALRGEPLVYVIGVDNDGNLHQAADQEPADWLAQMASSFDGSPPRLLFHVNVAVGDGPHDSVTALLFETDEFPYVLNIPGMDRREVPIRVATGTASANRRQLMRILAPTVVSPPTEVSELTVDARLNRYADAGIANAPRLNERTELSLHVRGRVFIEYTGTHAVSIPFRAISTTLEMGEERYPLELRIHELRASAVGAGRPPNPEPIPPRFGVHAKNRVVVATGPGEFSFGGWVNLSSNDDGQTPESLSSLSEQFIALERALFEIRFKFVGADTTVVLTAAAERQAREAEVQTDTSGYFDRYLGSWSMLAIH